MLNIVLEYLVARAEILDQKIDLSESEIKNLFSIGFRNFSGVEVNELGFPCWDDQEPKSHKGLLNSFICFYITKHYITKP
jgi:hypothetical protein